MPVILRKPSLEVNKMGLETKLMQINALDSLAKNSWYVLHTKIGKTRYKYYGLTDSLDGKQHCFCSTEPDNEGIIHGCIFFGKRSLKEELEQKGWVLTSG